ncbi:histidinol phosphatase [Antarcticibacterium sp. 1MA-6-2]|uniref:tyrosine-protein phosphatase n=1 Tax=Antarcticibacterium sp. 1MA-6-2 TaxID=2908210 RepID=UPI001F2C3099|nr:CpsB/CapC family capsule biosynthesis tyrosine phosphatase [Antarcticibacterium sp. 1MA-6-2]UJH91337.1 histidinol phosphatase [Antarcticibacterium sp. 1MA-6-2]
MLNIFKSKIYLKDLLQGITDIHNHILPGIDDGAANEIDSVQLLLKFKELGITKFIATPHVMNDYYPNTRETINNALSLLKNKIIEDQELQKVKIKAAAEYMMDQSFMEILEKKELLCLNENYVLVEMSFFQAPINLNEILFKLQTQGYRPILAHPERYAFYHSKDLSKYADLKNRGCLFQINALSLSPHYGSQIQEIGFRLLEAG